MHGWAEKGFIGLMKAVAQQSDYGPIALAVPIEENQARRMTTL